MVANARYLSYKSTGAFSALVNDYLDKDPALAPFYNYAPGKEGIAKAIEDRKKFPVNREKLVNYFQIKYKNVLLAEKVQQNIKALINPGTFTICTAHQPNIFTGHLYFIYKILHAIKLADELNKDIPGYHFVPVYYMGSEDADLQELGEIEIGGKKYTWETKQTGAVGRMKIDPAFIKLIGSIAAQVSVQPYGPVIMDLVRSCYQEGITVAEATFQFVNQLFQDYGLLILDADDTTLKASFIPVIENELETQFSAAAVTETIAALPEKYKVQVTGRELNLFYLVDDSRERIELKQGRFFLADATKSWSKEELFAELHQHPERFSPNVILRPLYQETILPGIVFIGGGGELAYWLELKKVFELANVFFPVLLLRNSFLLIEEKFQKIIKDLQVRDEMFFNLDNHFREWVTKNASNTLNLEQQKEEFKTLYEQVRNISGAVDPSLHRHVSNLEVKALKKIVQLEQKMFRAEKKKHEAIERQLRKLKDAVYPGGVLQERKDNLIYWYSRWGNKFLKMLYEKSGGLQQEFCVVEEDASRGRC